MIRKLISRLFAKARGVAAPTVEPGVSHGAKPDPAVGASATPKARRAARSSRGRDVGPVMVPPSAHGIDPKLLAANATRVTKTLQDAGFKAFVVGGAVRDLLLHVKPKDFDVATDATPEEIQRLFRRAHIIGRRFRLVHVMFGADTIEVSTFRAGGTTTDAAAPSPRSGEPVVQVIPPEPDDRRGRRDRRPSGPLQMSDEHGRVLRDNVFGSQEEDAARRDFTVNALFYDPATQTVIDYHHGVEDVKARTLRMIGDPEKRYREDPVRMLRAVRFAAKLQFGIDEATREPISRLAPLLENVPAARLFDEMLKLLLSGHALACLKRLRAEGLHHGMLPLLDVVLEQPMGERFVTLALESTDERIRLGKPTTPSFLFASLMWHEVLKKWEDGKARGELPIPALGTAMDEVLDAQTEKLAIQRRYTADMREIWGLQPRLERRIGRAPWRLLEHPRFRAGYDFLLLRAAAGEIDASLAECGRRSSRPMPKRARRCRPTPASPRRAPAARSGSGGGRRRPTTTASRRPTAATTADRTDRSTGRRTSGPTGASTPRRTGRSTTPPGRPATRRGNPVDGAPGSPTRTRSEPRRPPAPEPLPE